MLVYLVIGVIVVVAIVGCIFIYNHLRLHLLIEARILQLQRDNIIKLPITFSSGSRVSFYEEATLKEFMIALTKHLNIEAMRIPASSGHVTILKKKRKEAL